MTQFTASEIREESAKVFCDHSISDLECRARRRAMLRAFADLLEAQEKAVPVAVVKDSDALYTGYLSWTGESVPPETKLYTHPAPADAERLAEAMQELADKYHELLWLLRINSPVRRDMKLRCAISEKPNVRKPRSPHRRTPMTDTMTLEQVRSNMRDAMNSVLKDDTRRIVVDWYNAIDAAIKQREQDAAVTFAPPRTEADVMAYLHIARLHITRFNELIQKAMAKESGNG